MHAANACTDGRMRYECTLGADIDAKVDAITKLQAEFEAGTEVSLPPHLVCSSLRVASSGSRMYADMNATRRM